MPWFASVGHDETAWVDSATMAEIDRVMVHELGISLLQMMENAGRSLAELTVTLHRPDHVTILAGPGGNGGGGLVAARHLANIGVEVDIVLTAAHDRLSPAAAHQEAIATRMGLPVSQFGDAGRPFGADVVIDAMVGYSLQGPLRSQAADAAAALAEGAVPVISLDVPSGLDASSETTGPDDSVTAGATLTLCLPKVALRNARGAGDLYLADISVPPQVVTDCTGGPAPPFDRGRILHVLP